MKKATIAFACTLILSADAFAAVPKDFDSDGISDLARIEVQDDRSLLWKATLSSTSADVTLGTIGQDGDTPIMAQWLGSGTQIGVVTEESDGDSLLWSIIDSSGNKLEKTFGKKGDLAISGADFNGNGAADAAVARLVNGRAELEVAFDLFVETTPKTQTLTFGKSGDRVFYARLDSTGVDWVGVMGKGKRNRVDTRMRNLVTGELRRLPRMPRLAVQGSRPRAFAIRQEQGADLLAFQTTVSGNTRISVFSLDGVRVANTELSGSGVAVVGEYTSSPGYEIIFQGDSKSTVVNPTSLEQTEGSFVDGTPVDEININVIGSAPNPDPPANDGDGSGSGGGGAVASCSSIISWPSGHIYKTIGSTHFSPGDVRRNTIGLVIKPGGRGPFPGCLKAVDTSGRVVAQLGLYSRNDGWAARYYAGVGCGSGTPYNGAAVASRARANTGSSKIYINFDGLCYGPIEASVCVGSSQC
jgi:hypothetical protein